MWNSKKKKKQQEEIKRIVAPYDDIEPENVKYLIRNSEDNYIVFLDADGELDWETTDNCDATKEKLFSDTLSELCVLQQDACVLQMDKEMSMQYNRLLGGVLVAALDKNEVSARKLLKKVKIYLQSREYEITRKWFVENCLICLSAATFAFLLLRNQSCCFSKDGIRCLYFGIVGGVWSVLQQNGKQKNTCSAGRWMVFLEVISRLIISSASAFIIWKAYQAGVVFANFSSGIGKEAFETCLYIVAGFSERLAPSLIERFEDTKEDTKDEKENTDIIESGT